MLIMHSEATFASEALLEYVIQDYYRSDHLPTAAIYYPLYNLHVHQTFCSQSVRVAELATYD